LVYTKFYNLIQQHVGSLPIKVHVSRVRIVIEVYRRTLLPRKRVIFYWYEVTLQYKSPLLR